MRKKLISFLMAMATIVSLTMPAVADIIWEPEDSFYQKHSDECVYDSRAYEFAGYDGSVTVWSAPEGTAQQTQPNGRRVRVQFRWTGNDVEWGYFYGLEGSIDDGWIPMDDLTLVYDSQQFQADHASEIQNGAPVPVEFDSAVLYTYPGGQVSDVLKEDAEYMPFSEVFSTLYTDGNGLRWGYVGYYMGRRDSWVCLDDPMNERLDTNIVAVEPSAAQLRGAPTVTPGAANRMPLGLAGVLVALVVVVTLLVIRKVRPKKR